MLWPCVAATTLKGRFATFVLFLLRVINPTSPCVQLPSPEQKNPALSQILSIGWYVCSPSWASPCTFYVPLGQHNWRPTWVDTQSPAMVA